jgi:Core-2/I-Branching enzyme
MCLYVFLIVPWKLSTIYGHDGDDVQGNNEKQVPQQQQRKRRNGEVNAVDYDIEEDLPLGGHFLAGVTDNDSNNNNNSVSYSCSCDDSSYTKVDSDCRNRNDRAADGASSHRRCGARIFYLVGIHNNRTLQDAVPLFRSIRDPRNTILFHFDVKFGLSAYHESALRREVEDCPCGANVEVVSVHNCSWGSWSMLSPTLWSMEQAVTKYAGRWDVYINLSGDTLPVYTQDRIADLFAGPLKGINFITSAACETGLRPTSISIFPKKWHKRSHYSYQPANLEYVDDDGVFHHDVQIETYFGSQWMSLTPSICEWFVKQLKRPNSLPSQFRDYLIRTKKLMTDETFIPTMIMKFFPGTVPNITDDLALDSKEISMYSIRYERMDEHVPSAFGYYTTEQRYEVPKSSGVEQPRPWGPYFLGIYDLDNIRTSGALFIRKVAQVIDDNIYRVLPVDDPHDIPRIGWPTEVKISPVPDWEKTVAEYKSKAEKERQANEKELHTKKTEKPRDMEKQDLLNGDDDDSDEEYE